MCSHFDIYILGSWILHNLFGFRGGSSDHSWTDLALSINTPNLNSYLQTQHLLDQLSDLRQKVFIYSHHNLELNFWFIHMWFHHHHHLVLMVCRNMHWWKWIKPWEARYLHICLYGSTSFWLNIKGRNSKTKLLHFFFFSCLLVLFLWYLIKNTNIII